VLEGLLSELQSQLDAVQEDINDRLVLGLFVRACVCVCVSVCMCV